MSGWVIGYTLGVIVVLVVVVLVVTIIVQARAIGREAALINASLTDSVHHTAALAELRTTIDHAEVITAGLSRGRARLGG